MTECRPRQCAVIIDDDTWTEFRMLTIRHKTTMGDVLGEAARGWVAGHRKGGAGEGPQD